MIGEESIRLVAVTSGEWKVCNFPKCPKRAECQEIGGRSAYVAELRREGRLREDGFHIALSKKQNKRKKK